LSPNFLKISINNLKSKVMPSVKIRTAMSKKTGSMPKLSKDVKATGDSRKGKSQLREGGMYNPAKVAPKASAPKEKSQITGGNTMTAKKANAGSYNPSIHGEAKIYSPNARKAQIPSKMTTKKVTTVATPKNKEVTMQTRSTVTAKTNKKGKIKK